MADKEELIKKYKERIKNEFKKSFSDITYFARNYFYISHPTRGRQLFDLYDFQDKTLKEIIGSRDNIILKSRQMGISTLMSMYSLFLMVFYPDTKIVVVAINQDVAKNIVSKVRYAYNYLPKFFKKYVGDLTTDNRMSLAFKNDSSIKAITSTDNAGRSESATVLIIDEAAFIENIYTIWTSVQQTVGTGGRKILLSTPNGMSGFFHKKWTDAQNGENNFNPIKLPWYLHPERDEEWRRQQTVDLGEKLAAQECDCDFIASGDSFIENEIIKYYEDNFVQEPIEKRGVSGDYWIWKYPDYSKTYIVSCDVSRGDGTDFQTCEVFDIEDVEQVAEYKGQTDIKTFGNFVVNVATEYNDAILVIENTGIGWSAIQPAIDRDYDNLFYTHKNDKNIVSVKHALRGGIDTYNEQDMIPGFNTHERNRINILSKLKQYFLDRSLIIRSNRLINELYVFTWINNKPQAAKGYNDDLIMAMSILLWVRDVSLKLRQNNKELTKKMLERIGTYRNVHTAKKKKNENPYKVNLGGVQEDISWLL